MNNQIIQDDFGGFNPRFMGVTVKLSSPAAYDVLMDYAKRDALEDSEEASLQEVAIKSVLEHEIRHYHDFLISPYSNYLFRLRLQAHGNGVQAVNCAKSLAGNCMPAPLTDWLVTGDQLRSEQVAEWQEFTMTKLEPVVLPSLPASDLLKSIKPYIIDVRSMERKAQFDQYVIHAAMAYKRIEQIVAGFSFDEEAPENKPCNIYEATALTTQVVAIIQSQGMNSALRFIRFLEEAEMGYAKLWTHFYRLAGILEKWFCPDRDLHWRLAMVMAMSEWCLLGNYSLEGKKACPTDRFDRLLNHLVDDFKNGGNVEGNLADIWNYWDKSMGFVSWRKSLAELLKMNQRGIDFYAQITKTIGGSVSELTEKVLLKYVEEQKEIVEHILAQPHEVVFPNYYLNAPAGTFPTPTIRVELEGFAIRKGKASPASVRVLEEVQVKGKPYIKSFLLPLGGPNTEAFIEDAISMETSMQWCDILFSNHAVAPERFRVAKKSLQNYVGKEIFLMV